MRARALITYMFLRVFKFCYDRFAKDGTLTKQALDYEFVERAIRGEFCLNCDRRRRIETAMAMKFERGKDLLSFVHNVGKAFEYAGFSLEQNVLFLMKVMISTENIPSFMLMHSPKIFNDMNKTLEEYMETRDKFSKPNVVTPKHYEQQDIMVNFVQGGRIGDPREAVEDKVDASTNQLAELTLMVDKKTVRRGRQIW